MNHPSNHPRSDLSKQMFWPAIIILLLAKTWFSLTRYLNQDEFESLHQGWLIFSGAVQFRDFNSNHPPLSFAVLSLLNFFSDSPTMLIYLGRALTFLSAIACLVFIHGISNRVFDPQAARWTTIAYALNATFWEWSIEIRSDFIMLPLWLAAVLLIVSQEKKPKIETVCAIGFFMGLAFWANQKVVFHALPLGVFMLLGGANGQWKFRHTVLAVATSLIPSLIYVSQAYLNGSLGDLIAHNFHGAWNLVRDDDYAKWRLTTLEHAFTADTLFLILGIAGSIWAIANFANRKSIFIGSATLWMLASLYLTPGPFQYFLLSVFPLMAVAIGGLISRILNGNVASSLGDRELKWAVAIVMLLFCAAPFLRITRFIRPTIDHQLEVIAFAYRISDGNARVFDGSGTAVNRADAYPFHWVLWKGELERYKRNELPDLLPTLRNNQCEMVLDTYRVNSLPEDELHELQTQFVTWWGPIRVPGFDSIDPVGQAPIEFELWYDDHYETEQQNVVIDGMPFTSGKLSAGKHSVHVAIGQARVQLRRQTPADDSRPLREAPPASLFLGNNRYAL